MRNDLFKKMKNGRQQFPDTGGDSVKYYFCQYGNEDFYQYYNIDDNTGFTELVKRIIEDLEFATKLSAAAS